MTLKRERVLTWPDGAIPDSDSVSQKWINDRLRVPYGPVKTTIISGTVKCDNVFKDTEFGQTVRLGADGNPYNNFNGHKSTRTTKGRDKQWSSHWLGSTSGLPMNSDGNVLGADLNRAVIGRGHQCSFLRHVVGFICDISSAPDGEGSAADGSGRCEKWNISANYVNSRGEVKVYNMCDAGEYIAGHKFDSIPSNAWNWYMMSYRLHTKDREQVINQDLRHIGWCIQYLHHKYTGGDTRSKYCTGRVRFLQPLVGDVSMTVRKRHIVQPSQYMTWADAWKSSPAKIYTF